MTRSPIRASMPKFARRWEFARWQPSPCAARRESSAFSRCFPIVPNAFSDAHITLLKKLAKIAATGRSKVRTPWQAGHVETAPEAYEREQILVPLAATRHCAIGLRFLPARMRGEEGQPFGWLRPPSYCCCWASFAGCGHYRTRQPRSVNRCMPRQRTRLPAVMAAARQRRMLTRTRFLELGQTPRKASTINLHARSQSQPRRAWRNDLVQRASRLHRDRAGPARHQERELVPARERRTSCRPGRRSRPRTLRIRPKR